VAVVPGDNIEPVVVGIEQFELFHVDGYPLVHYQLKTSRSILCHRHTRIHKEQAVGDTRDLFPEELRAVCNLNVCSAGGKCLAGHVFVNLSGCPWAHLIVARETSYYIPWLTVFVLRIRRICEILKS
jgi:hypothetical protein